MSLLRNISRLRFIDYLVRKKSTGDLSNFAKKNRLSKSGLSIILQEMKQLGFPLKYNRSLNSYYYEEEGGMIECLFIKKGQVLSDEEIQNILGGQDSENICFSKYKIFELCNSNEG